MRVYHGHPRLIFLSYEQFVQDSCDGYITREQTETALFFLVGSRTVTLRGDNPLAQIHPEIHRRFIEAVTTAEKELRCYWYDWPDLNERRMTWLFNALLRANNLTDHPMYLGKDAER